MSPGVQVVWRDAGCWCPICCAQDKRDDPFRGCTRWKLWTWYRPDRPLSRVLHLHQACIPLEVARQRLQVDGKPHPTAPSHPQAAWARFSSEYQPLCHTACATPRWPRPWLDVHLHQVRLEDVGPRTPVQLHWATGCRARMLSKWTSTRSGALQLVMDGRRGTPWPAPPSMKVRGGERRWSVTLSFVRVEPPGSPCFEIAGHTPFGEELVRSDLPLREPVNDRHAHVGVAPTRSPPVGDEAGLRHLHLVPLPLVAAVGTCFGSFKAGTLQSPAWSSSLPGVCKHCPAASSRLQLPWKSTRLTDRKASPTLPRILVVVASSSSFKSGGLPEPQGEALGAPSARPAGTTASSHRTPPRAWWFPSRCFPVRSAWMNCPTWAKVGLLGTSVRLNISLIQSSWDGRWHVNVRQWIRPNFLYSLVLMVGSFTSCETTPKR